MSCGKERISTPSIQCREEVATEVKGHSGTISFVCLIRRLPRRSVRESASMQPATSFTYLCAMASFVLIRQRSHRPLNNWWTCMFSRWSFGLCPGLWLASAPVCEHGTVRYRSATCLQRALKSSLYLRMRNRDANGHAITPRRTHDIIGPNCSQDPKGMFRLLIMKLLRKNNKCRDQTFLASLQS